MMEIQYLRAANDLVSLWTSISGEEKRTKKEGIAYSEENNRSKRCHVSVKQWTVDGNLSFLRYFT